MATLKFNLKNKTDSGKNKGLKPDFPRGTDKLFGSDEERYAAVDDGERIVDVESAMSDSDGSTATRPGSRACKDGRKRPRRRVEEESSCSSSSGDDDRPAPKVRSGGSGRGRSSPAQTRDKQGRFLKREDASKKDAQGVDRSPSGSRGESVIRCIPKDGPKGRGRPPTTGAYVGLAKAKAALVAAEREALELQAEKEVAEAARKTYPLRSNRLSEISADEGPTAAELREQVLQQVDLIAQVAGKSSNLKGTFVRTLKDAAANIKDAVETLSRSTISAETRRLAANNDRLKHEVTELRGEVAALRADLRRTQAQPRADHGAQPLISAPFEPESLERSIIEAVGTMINARFEGIESRLLPERRIRPPLAADRVHMEVAAGSTAPIPRTYSRTDRGPVVATAIPAPLEAVADTGLPPTAIPIDGRKGKKGTKKKKSASQPNPTEGEWTVVTRRKAKSRKGPAPANQPAKPKSRRKPRLKPPKSSAVVLRLQPDAEERGVTYASILLAAKEAVDLGALGIPALRFRMAATGARVLELPGATSGEKADLLAEKLQQVLNKDDVRVSRPEKCADLRVSGLDDSINKSDVTETIARVGECSVTSIKTGEIRRDQTGLGTIIVSCPIGAAKKVVGADRLFIGWSSVQRKLLEPRPLRCYRCLELGHVKEQCVSEVDRSSACFRCGQLGHKAGQCSKAPHCLVCAAANKPASHRLGTKACASAKLEKKRKRRGTAGASTQTRPVRPAASEARADEIQMATT